MFRLLIVLAFVPAIFARTPIRECGGGIPLPDAVFFSSRETPCLTAPCTVSRRQGFGVTYVDFTTRAATTGIMPRVRAIVFGVTINQSLPDDIQNNPCSILELGSCPLSANQRASYRLQLPVESNTPLITTDTEISLLGDNDVPIFCYRLENRVVL